MALSLPVVRALPVTEPTLQLRAQAVAMAVVAVAVAVVVVAVVALTTLSRTNPMLPSP